MNLTLTVFVIMGRNKIKMSPVIMTGLFLIPDNSS